MGRSLDKSEMIAKVAEAASKTLGENITKKTTEAVIEAMVDLAYKEAKNKFPIPGLGRLTLVSRRARIGRNPRTGEPVHIKAKKVLKLVFAKAAKDAVSGT